LSIAIPAFPGDVNAQGFFTEAARVSYMSNPTPDTEKVKLQKKLKRGDLVRYGTTHISILHSDKPTCDSTSCIYEIIHAYGGDNYKKVVNGAEQKVFSRKVLITPNDISTTISNPTGFGRIKLVD